ncbi:MULTISPECIES: hypothetical protein [Vibrio]|uniref:hypothetical protein n=1 Tax=Vibrio TaxID=662 RepID=UPI00111F73EB|nr:MULTISPECIES: hypothetical protein [Vibrio]MDW2294712.1 hypothetical protein [Vibrio sp. 1404]MCA2455811.1 hypothetical protein [Vibrio alginolyticus]MCA2461117.1 hypothetical protein [Vibrio alginolyticus]MDW2267496.1 hypothetical protein [Vibrio sp. 1394]TON10901.1 hypothetical protein CGH63_12020 [Vibrio parahaemolyticus]
MEVLKIRVLPNSKAVDALCICYEHKRVYTHEGKQYFVTELDVEGRGRSTRLMAKLEPVFGGAMG